MRQKYSGADYRSIVTVGNFVGDGAPTLLVQTLNYAGVGPQPTGDVEMCRVSGDDTTGGAGKNDANMICEPAGVNVRNADLARNNDRVYFMDVLGTGRMQLVKYHGGYVGAGGAWIEDAGATKIWRADEAAARAGSGTQLESNGNQRPSSKKVEAQPKTDKDSLNTTPSSKTPNTVWEDAKEALLISDIQRVYVTGKKLVTDTANYIGGNDEEKQAAGASFKANGAAYIGLGTMFLNRGRRPARSAAALSKFPSRSAALNQAKRDLGIPRSQHPERVDSIALTDSNGTRILGADNQPIMTREYTYNRPDGSPVVIQEHSAGHQFGQGGRGDQGPHFNVSPPP